MVVVQDSPALRSKYFSMLRVAQMFQDEIRVWLDHADKQYGYVLGRNFSQLQRLKRHMDEMALQNEPFIKKLSLGSKGNEFLTHARLAAERTQVVEFVWNYFRDKLELRLLPQFQHSLWAADLIVYDCYTTIMTHAEEDLAIRLQMDDQGQKLYAKREAPLPYLDVGLRGAVTYRRHATPTLFEGNRFLFKDLYERNRSLPLALIELPANLAQSVWEFVLLGHEVTHDVDGDLNTLHDDLPATVETLLKKSDEKRRNDWMGWTLEVFADLMALRLMGPMYAHRCFQHLAMENVISLKYPGYPSHYLRMLLLLTYLGDYLGFKAESDALKDSWRELFGDLPGEQVAYKDDFGQVIQALMNTPLPALTGQDGKQHAPGELVDFTSKQHKDVETTKGVLLAVVKDLQNAVDDDETLRTEIRKQLGNYVIEKVQGLDGGVREILINESKAPPPARHIASAAYVAFEELLRGNGGEVAVAQRLRLLNLVGQELVKAKQPALTLAGAPVSKDERDYISAQSKNLFALLLPSTE